MTRLDLKLEVVSSADLSQFRLITPLILCWNTVLAVGKLVINIIIVLGDMNYGMSIIVTIVAVSGEPWIAVNVAVVFKESTKLGRTVSAYMHEPTYQQLRWHPLLLPLKYRLRYLWRFRPKSSHRLH